MFYFLSENSKFLRLILKRYLIQSFTEFLPALLKQAYVSQLHRKCVLLISNHRVQMQKNSVMSKVIQENAHPISIKFLNKQFHEKCFKRAVVA